MWLRLFCLLAALGRKDLYESSSTLSVIFTQTRNIIFWIHKNRGDTHINRRNLRNYSIFHWWKIRQFNLCSELLRWRNRFWFLPRTSVRHDLHVLCSHFSSNFNNFRKACLESYNRKNRNYKGIRRYCWRDPNCYKSGHFIRKRNKRNWKVLLVVSQSIASIKIIVKNNGSNGRSYESIYFLFLRFRSPNWFHFYLKSKNKQCNWLTIYRSRRIISCDSFDYWFHDSYLCPS